MATRKRQADGIGNDSARARTKGSLAKHEKPSGLFVVLLCCLGAWGCSKPSTERVSKQSERLEVTSGVVAAYDFDEGSGTTTADVSGTGNTATLSGASWVPVGRRGAALSFDGTNDRVTVADASSLDLTSGMTLMAWVKPASAATDWSTVVMKELGTADLAYALYSSDGTEHPLPSAFTGGSNTASVFGGHVPRTDRWTHLATTYDGSTLSLYINGKLQNTSPLSGSLTTSSEVLTIGGNAMWGEWFNGLIDEVRVYNRGLSLSEITLEMGGIAPGPAPELVAAYDFDQGTGSTTTDASGHSNTGSVLGATWAAAGKHGGALAFDGTNDRVLIADSASLDLMHGMTLSAWVNPTSLNGWSTVILKELETSDLVYALYAGDASLLPVAYLNHDGVAVNAQGPTELPLDTWSHLAVAYDDVTMSLYVNGTLAASVEHNGDIATSDEPIGIGGNAIWGEWFEGRIDDVRIYNNGLTAAQVVTDMNTPVGTGGGCGTSCDDGNPCNGIETCVSNSCVAGTPVTCTASDQCHDAGTCNPATGVCSNPPKANGTACNDTNACTQTDTCQTGTCSGSNPVTCSASDSCHDEGTCNTSTGVCSNPAKPDGSACNDATVCNGSESCQSGSCAAGTPPALDDANPCTADTCDPVAGVSHTPVTAGTSCSNNNACDGAETCNASATCVAGTPPVTNDGNPCTTDACDPVAGVTNTPVSAGTSCANNNTCDGAETCNAAGICVTGTPIQVDDDNPCTTDACDPIAGVTHTPVTAGTSCSNNNDCDGAETCEASATCVAGTPPETNDGNPCTTDACDALAGVTHTPVAAGTLCLDANSCNGAEACNATGSCEAGTPPTLNDGNPCTVDSCDQTSGVSHTPVPAGTSCSDLDLCNGAETCDAAGTCQLGAPVSTDDDNECTGGSCDPLTGVVTQAPLPTGTECFLDVCTVAECNAAGECTAAGSSIIDDGDPCTIEWCDPEFGPQVKTCTPIDRTVGTTLHESMKWIYEEPNPPQIGVAPGTIEVRRAAALHGVVKARDGSVLPGVKVTILDHHELGYTLTHADGTFDMVVNGGGQLIVSFEREGYLHVQRPADTVWGEHAAVPTIVMIPPDPIVTSVDLANPPDDLQVARGSVQSDSDGERQGTLLIPSGTQATMHLSDGSTAPLESMNVRITEFTVGATGPQAMPGALPAESKYTYAFEVNADEAVSLGAPEITFDVPLIYYVENFLEFPAGIPVPLGSFDRGAGAWKAEESGVIIDIVGESGGLADLDVTGDGLADSEPTLAAYGIDTAERQTLADIYAPGSSLWRMPIPHFTRPWDANWGAFPPPDAIPPSGPPPAGPHCGDCCPGGGGLTGVTNASSIQCDSQTLGERIPIAGTPYTLNYSSRRMPDRIDEREIRIPLSTTVPGSLSSIHLEISVAGRTIEQSFPPQANQETVFVWDGLDKFGRRVQGAQRATITRRFVYPLIYTIVPIFGYNGNGISITGGPARGGGIALNDFTNLPISAVDTRPLGLGGWTLDVHHVGELADRRIELGTGQRLGAQVLSPIAEVLSTQGGVGTAQSMAVASDGTAYHSAGYQIFRVLPGAGPELFIGTASSAPGYAGDGLPATDPSVRVSQVRDLALGRDGSLYLAEQGNHIVRRVDPDGIIGTFAGTAEVAGYTGDGGPATLARLREPSSIAVSPSGSVFIAERTSIRRVDPDGSISTVAGLGVLDSGTPPLVADGIVATSVRVEARAIAVAPDGTLYAAGMTDCGGPIQSGSPTRIYRFVDGLMYLVAGGSCFGNVSDNLPAKQTSIQVRALAFDQEGRLYFVDQIAPNLSETFNRIRTISVADGTIKTVAASGAAGDLKTGMPLLAFQVSADDVTTGPSGLYGSGNVGGASVLFRAGSPIPANTGAPFTIGARGENAFNSFDKLGRHLATRHALTGANLQTFGYDTAGRLVTVSDESSRTTIIERNASGVPTALVAPFGQRTLLDLDANGWLASVTDPEGNETRMTYTSGGLLQTFTNARGLTSSMDYDALGRLELDTDPAGGSHTLVRTGNHQSSTVERTTALERSTSYVTTNLGPGARTTSVTDPAGNLQHALKTPDGTSQTTAPDGTVVTTTESADIRFGMNAPVVARSTRLPSGLTQSETTSRTYVALNPVDPTDFQSVTDGINRNGRHWQTHYSTANRTFTTISPQGRQTFRVLDPQGRTARTQVAGLLPVDFSYDTSGRLDHVAQGFRTTQNTYFSNGAAAGYLASITDATNTATSFTRDALGRTITETRSTATTAFDWDPLSNLASVTPAGKPIHEMTYTPVNLLETYEPPPAALPVSSTGYTYDLDRMLRTETRPGGISIVRTPDSVGRLDTVAIPGGLIDYDYFPSNAPSGAGKTSDIRGPYGVDLAFTYDGSLTTSTSWSGDVIGSVAWQYNNDFQKILETVSGATGTASTAFGYDNDLLLTCVSPTTCSPPGADALRLTRHPQHGMVTGITLGETSETWSYNAYGELARQTASFDGSPLVDITYDEAGFERDALGRILRKTETILGVTKTYEYRYDALRRLDQVKIDGVVDEEFTYDANGNRLTAYKAGQGTVTATYDDQDRLLTYGTYEFTYTANGELETKTNTANGDEWLFQYDALGNLLSVGLPNGDLVEYLVDGMGRRVRKMKNGVLLRQWIYRDLLKSTAELDGAGNLVSAFVYGAKPNVPDYVVRGGATYRVLTDHLGSPRYAVNIANATDIPFQAHYSSFGEVAGTSLDWLPFKFAGGHFDSDTGLVRFGAREYDPAVGRWLSKDPIGFGGAQTNLYIIPDNDPIRFRDYSGLEDLCGSKNSPVPSWLILDDVGVAGLEDACRKHDECYATCGSSKATCDVNLFKDVLGSCRWGIGAAYPFVLVPLAGNCTVVASAYYGGVHFGGGSAYDAAQSDCSPPEQECK